MKQWVSMPNVIGKVKSFSKDLYKKYDEPARKKVKEILGDFIIDNPNIYQQDFIINSDKIKYKYLEIQVCSDWINKYPYDKIFVYARKLKYSDDTLFLTISKNLKYGYLFKFENIKEAKPKRKKKYSREFIYEIPIENALHVYIDYLDTLTFYMYA